MRDLRTTLAVSAAALLVAACGVPTQGAFDAADSGAFDVDPPVVTEAASTPTDDRAVLPVRPHFVSEQGITAGDTVLSSYDAILVALQTRPEDGSGLRTAVSTETVTGIRDDGNGVVVDLTEAFQSLPPEEQRLAAAQIVLTVTDRLPAVRVRFALDDQPVDVPTADNTVSLGGSVARADYLALLATS